MKKKYLETGRIINTHGVRGEVKIDPWADSPDFLCGIKTFYIDNKPYKVSDCKVHNRFVIAKLDGVDNMDAAVRFKNKIIFADRDDMEIESGAVFLQDLIGLKVLDSETEDEIGTLSDIMELPAGNVYVVSGEREILVPANDVFVKETNADGGYIKVSLIEGM